MFKFILPICLLASALTGAQSASHNQYYYKSVCAEHTGLTMSEITKVETRNEGCTLDCIQASGLLGSYPLNENKPCSSSDDLVCKLGYCEDRDAKVSADGLLNLTIGILSAQVPDKDDVPGAGEADTFFVVQISGEAGPAYRGLQIACSTHVVQDNTSPVFNYSCKPAPLLPSATISFRAWDSDSPVGGPEFIGAATTTVGELYAKDAKPLKLVTGPEGREREVGWVRVRVTGSSYY